MKRIPVLMVALALSAIVASARGLLENAAAWTNGPYIALTGDSVMAGYPNYTPYYAGFAGSPSGDVTCDPAHMLTTICGVTATNFAVSGQTWASILGFEAEEGLATKPKYLLCASGANDIAQGVTWDQAASRMIGVRSLCRQSNVTMIVSCIMPAVVADSLSLTMRQWNTNYQQWCATNDAIFEDLDGSVLSVYDRIGKLRVSTGYFDDPKDGYTVDGRHMAALGITNRAEVIFEFLSILENSTLNIPSGLLPGGGTWTNCGVVGGIPSVTTTYTNFSPSGNASTDWTNIETALLLCPSNQAVTLAAGTYLIPSRGLSWGSVGNSWLSLGGGNNGVVLRGAGIGKTVLYVTDSSIGIQGYYGTAEDMTNMMYRWTSGYAQSTTNITIGTNFLGGSATGLAAGDLIMLTQENDTNFVTTLSSNGQPAAGLPNGNDAWSNACNEVQWVRVVSVSNGTNLTIWPGVYMTNYQASLRPQIFWHGDHYLTEKCGIEEMTVVNATTNLSWSGVTINNAYNCWVKNVEFSYPGYSSVNINRSAHCTMEGCYSHDSASGGAASSYGAYAGLVSDCLFENNVFDKITAPILFQGGTAGCVAGYNFASNGVYSVSPNGMPNALNLHEAHVSMNLLEGNVAVSIAGDIIHGSSSHNTGFRNAISGWQTNKTDNTFPVDFAAWNRYESLIGNVLGKDGYHTNYELTPQNYPTNAFDVHSIYYLGFMGNGLLDTNDDPIVVTTLWREGNYDYATHSTIWDGDGAKTLPASLYLTSKPSWWGSGAWPNIGSDLTPMVSAIPAEVRYQSLIAPVSGSARVTTMRATNTYLQ